MNEENILDAGFNQYQSNPIMDSINWWERKRGLYNLVVIGFQIILILFFWDGTLQFGITNAIIGSIAYTIAANIFFSIGWGINIIIYHYNIYFLKKIDEYRMFFFIMGISVSIFLTVSTYAETLYSYYVLSVWPD